MPGTVVQDRVHVNAGRNEGVHNPLVPVSRENPLRCVSRGRDPSEENAAASINREIVGVCPSGGQA